MRAASILNGCGEIQRIMSQQETSKRMWIDTFNSISLIASVLLIVGISIEIMHGDHIHFSEWYMFLQLCVCIVFIITLILRLSDAERRRRHLVGDVLFLLISIPYLNILNWIGVDMSADMAHVIGFIPILRSMLAMTIIVDWLVKGRSKRLLAAYLITVVMFTYIAALIFFDYEMGVNPKLTNFGNALWWAWMNVTTVGAEIFPVTAIGKIVCVLLPSVGMMFFPIFTVYVSQYYTSPDSGKNDGAK